MKSYSIEKFQSIVYVAFINNEYLIAKCTANQVIVSFYISL